MSEKQAQDDDQFLTRYLLGSLSQEEAERVDELSITSDDFAWHLSAIENELVDAYVRGELSGEALDQFRLFYLASSPRREKVQFAQALRVFQNRKATATAFVPTMVPARSGPKFSLMSWFLAGPSPVLRWGFAAVLLLMLFSVSYLLLQNLRLRDQLTQSQSGYKALEQRAHQLETQLNEQHLANTEIPRTSNPNRESTEKISQLKVVALFLLPQTRGAGQIKTLPLSSGVGRVKVKLGVESDDFPLYQVTLKDPATNRVLWRSTNLKTRSERKSKTLSFILPTNLLKQKNYMLEASGIGANGTSEFVNSYVFKVVIK